MRKLTLWVFAGLCLCFSLLASQACRADIFSPVSNSLLRAPSLTLSDQLFSFSTAFNQMETTPADFLPALSLATMTPQRPVAASRATDSKDFSKDSEAVEVRRNLLDYVH